MATVLLVGLLGVGGAATAAADTTPGTPGPPNQNCQALLSQPGGETPGHTSSSPGSVFDEQGFGTGNNGLGGKGGNAYNTAGAPSQYDVACFQATMHG